MFNYLLNYGVKISEMDYNDLDVNDRMQLQDQINEARRNYSKLLKLMDDVQEKYIQCTKELSIRTKNLIAENDGVKNNTLFSTDEEYLSLSYKSDALKTGIQMISNQIDFVKNDLRILNSVFYNKF